MDQYRRISITTGRSGKDFNDSYVGEETSANDAVLDRLPPAQIVKKEENGAVIEAEVYGKGNEDWNWSAPHGAGRLYSRKDTESRFTLEEYEKTMREAGIYSTSIDQSTLDECPMAYKGMKDIVDHIGPTAEIVKVLQPVYNFKASKTKWEKVGGNFRW